MDIFNAFVVKITLFIALFLGISSTSPAITVVSTDTDLSISNFTSEATSSEIGFGSSEISIEVATKTPQATSTQNIKAPATSTPIIKPVIINVTVTVPTSTSQLATTTPIIMASTSPIIASSAPVVEEPIKVEVKKEYCEFSHPYTVDNKVQSKNYTLTLSKYDTSVILTTSNEKLQESKKCPKDLAYQTLVSYKEQFIKDPSALFISPIKECTITDSRLITIRCEKTI